MNTVIGAGIVTFGMTTALAVSGAPAAAVAGVALAVPGMIGAAAAWTRLRRRWRSRARIMRLPALTGNGRWAAAVFASAGLLAAAAFALLGSARGTAASGTAAVLLVLWCAASARPRGARPDWTAEELLALEDDLALRELLRAAPDGRREGKFR